MTRMRETFYITNNETNQQTKTVAILANISKCQQILTNIRKY